MRFEFNQGVPKGCIDWLVANVGKGNRASANFSIIYDEDNPEYDWFYQRVQVPIPSTDPARDSSARYVPTITVKDEKKAIVFALRWL